MDATRKLDHDALLTLAERSLSTIPRPFLRWAGSKQKLLRYIVPLLPQRMRCYYEPFLGSGALFFLLRPKQAVLGDTAEELIAAYEAVRDGPSHVLRYLHGLDPKDRDLYYDIREHRSDGHFRRTAELIYMNRAAWNGLYRVNASGEFNVPFGAPKTSFVIERRHLLACAAALKPRGVRLLNEDFEETLDAADRGDLVFLDPPYVTRHNNNGFVDYNEELFSWSDQERLATVAQRLARRGAHVIVANAHHKDLLRLFAGFSVVPFSRSSTLAGASNARGRVTEALFIGGPKR